MGFTIDNKDVMHGFDKLNNHVKSVVKEKVENYAVNIEQYMRINAPWEDRTGEARRGLRAELNVENDGIFRIALSHTVEYGIYLEYREFSVKGRLQIIEPTLDYMTSGFIKILEGII